MTRATTLTCPLLEGFLGFPLLMGPASHSWGRWGALHDHAHGTAHHSVTLHAFWLLFLAPSDASKICMWLTNAGWYQKSRCIFIFSLIARVFARRSLRAKLPPGSQPQVD